MRSRAQLAHEWGVSLSTVKRLTARADFPTPVRLGGSVRWVAAELDDVLDQSMDVAGYPIRIHPPTASRPYHQIVYRVDGERRVTSGGRTIKTATDKAAAIAARLAADADQARRGAIPADQFSPGSNSVSESLCRRGLGAWSAPATETAC